MKIQTDLLKFKQTVAYGERIRIFHVAPSSLSTDSEIPEQILLLRHADNPRDFTS